ncbi:MAG: HipA N-terminal domain-containing protein [Methanosarcinales archaeon]|jgi:serine/threonine-protein kinase HipA|nr:HipA N-terminal domain-containing protein [Methanosarcinales archaeon]
MKQAVVYMYDIPAGMITEDDEGYLFRYNEEYLKHPNAEAVSMTMPLQKEAYRNKYLFPFFDGLIPEGWLLEIAEKTWKIPDRDRMSLLLACCRDCIGAVSVIPIE